MNLAHKPEIQLQLPFEEPPARDDFPDAILNDVGVMVGNLIRRTYTGTRSTMGTKDSMTITVGHRFGIWAAGRSLRIDTEYTGCAPSFKWGKYDSMSEAIDDCIDWAVIALRRKIASKFADAREKSGAQELLELIERGQHEEEVTYGSR